VVEARQQSRHVRSHALDAGLVDPSEGDAGRVGARFDSLTKRWACAQWNSINVVFFIVAIAPEWRPGVRNPTRNGIPMNDLRLTGITVPDAFTEWH